jgi:hypothetical protein
MKKLACAAFLFLMGVLSVRAQESLFQSSDGESAVFLSSQPSGSICPDARKNAVGAVLYNFSASAGKFSYLHQDSGMKSLGFGFDVGGTLKQGSVPIIHANASAPGVSLDGAVVKQLKAIDALKVKPSLKGDGTSTYACFLCSHWLVFQARFNASQFYTVPTSVAPFPTPTKQEFNGAQGVLGYNALLKTNNADWLLGGTLGAGLLNNTGSLTSAQYTNNQITTTGSTQEIIGQGAQTVYVGNYLTFAGVPINADAIVFPGVFSGTVGFDLFVRSNMTSADRYATPGLGLFISKPGQPARPAGGVTASYKNGKGEVSLVAGWSF